MIGVMSWFCLRLHAGYRCRHVGACCRADWEIPAEAHVLQAVEVESLRASEGARRLMDELEHGIDLRVPRRADGACLFFEPGASGSCAIHLEAGEAALPTACRHFPREVLVDGRGTFVSLSHYCPTAAALLTIPSALDIVEAMPPLRLAGPVDGLDATDVLPPLVRHELLGDLEGYAAWEAAGLATLAREDLTAGEALDRIEAATELVRTWVPGDGSLAATVDAAFRTTQASPARRRLIDAFAPLLAQHIPPESAPLAGFENTWAPRVEGDAAVDLVVKNYLAARLFGNWIAYQGRGLRTIVEWLRACHAVLRNEMALRSMASGRAAAVDDAVAAAGRADLLLVHTIDSASFASYYVEREKT